VEGRYFSREFNGEENSVVINERAAEILGLTNPIGTRFYKEFGDTEEGEFVTVIGVIKNIYFSSLHYYVEPMIIRFLSDSQGWTQYTSVKISGDDVDRSLKLIEKKWKELTVDQPFEYTFLDEDFNRLYDVEMKTGKLISVFSGLSFLIAGLGLLGLISFSTQQRTKEIGIRKVLGANIRGIIYLLSRETIVLVLISTFLAGVAGYLIMNKWLQNFAYHTDVGFEAFLLSGLFTMLIALITVSFQTIKAANSNPVEVLKYE
jgi:putative ABC transport system permease protein